MVISTNLGYLGSFKNLFKKENLFKENLFKEPI